jgi:hypothetical protein
MATAKTFSAAFAVLLAALAGPQARAETHAVVPAAEPVAGLSQVEWSRAWWQWAGAFDYDESPVTDRTGELCASKQSGDVWFLAGTFGTKRTVRTCTVPRGKYLFFPLVNHVALPRGHAPTSCLSLTSMVAAMTDEVSSLVLEVDGVRVDKLAEHRQATKQCFDLGALSEPKARVFPSAANGYYVMLRPLSPGKHTLNFGGALPGTLQAVTYTLYVE